MFFPLLFLLLQPTFVTSTTCIGSTYLYDGSDCSPCPLGATFISSSLGCAPSSFPLDTKFYLSGTQTEGVSAFSTSTIVTYSTDVFGTVNGAMNLASGGVISLMGSSLSSAMPQQTDDFTLSTWIKADPQTSSVIGWGNLGDVDRGLLSTKTAGIFVSPSGTMTEESMQLAASHDLYTPYGVAVGKSGKVYVTDNVNGIISIIPDTWSGPTDFIFGLSNPVGIAIDVNENIWVTESTTHKIKKFSGTDSSNTFSKDAVCPGTGQVYLQYIALDFTGNFAYYTCQATNGAVKKISNNGNTITTVASLSGAIGIAVDKWNNVFVSLQDNKNVIMKISPNSDISTFVSFGLNQPRGLAVDGNGNIYIADEYHFRVHKISPSGIFLNSLNMGDTSPRSVACDVTSDDLFIVYSSGRFVHLRPKLYLPVCDSTWHHVAITRSSQKTQLAAYIDGKLISQHAFSPTLPLQSSSLLIIGNDFSGTVSDVRIYNRILGPSELEALSQPSAATFPGQNLALYSSSPNGYTFQFTCKLGYSGPLAVLSKSNLDNSYSWTTTPNCIQCEAGTFSSSQSGITICHLCPPGTYSLVGASSCTPCQAGEYSSAGATTCEDCGVGKFSSTTGASSCSICSAGSSAAGPTATSCVSCVAGSTYSAVGAGSCSSCQTCSGTGVVTISPCSVLSDAICGCASGYDQSGSSGSILVCTLTSLPTCIAGSTFLSSATGACTTCRSCTGVGISTISACSVSTNSICGCLGGYSQSGISGSNLICTICPAGSWSSPGSTSCSLCSPGTYSLSGASVCTPCPIGTYGNNAGLTTSACSGNCTLNCTTTGLVNIPSISSTSTSSSISSAITLSCPAGTWAAQGALSCTFCPPGTYSFAGASSCLLCPAGTYGSSAGLTTSACSGSCTDCLAGSAFISFSSLTTAVLGVSFSPLLIAIGLIAVNIVLSSIIFGIIFCLVQYRDSHKVNSATVAPSPLNKSSIDYKTVENQNFTKNNPELLVSSDINTSSSTSSSSTLDSRQDIDSKIDDK
jgi:streptogramin lyase